MAGKQDAGSELQIMAVRGKKLDAGSELQSMAVRGKKLDEYRQVFALGTDTV